MEEKRVLSLEERIQLIDASGDLLSLGAGALPPVQSDEYYFVSYSHKDYKMVYKDILRLQEAGISIWYDRGLPPGQDWEVIAEEAISKYACTGVLFYLSENAILSESIHREINYVKNKGKSYLSINIPSEDGRVCSATEMLRKVCPELSSEDEKYRIIDDTFNERVTYIDYTVPIENKVDKILLLERPPLIVYEIDEASKSATVVAVNNIDTCEAVISESVIENGEEYAVTRIAPCAFANCRSLKRVLLPSGITRIPNRAFYNCASLKEITFDCITEIGEQAFWGCTSLNEVELCRVSRLESSAFNNCKALKRALLRYDVIMEGAPFSYCGLERIDYIDKYEDVINTHNALISPIVDIGIRLACKNTVIPLTCNVIGEWAFSGVGIVGLDIPFSVEKIGEQAFSGCYRLKEVSLPDSVSELGNGVFSRCKALKKVKLSRRLTEIKAYAFWGCTELCEIRIPKSVKKISTRAFAGCTSLRSVVFETTDIEVDGRAFEGSPNVVFYYGAEHERAMDILCNVGIFGDFVPEVRCVDIPIEEMELPEKWGIDLVIEQRLIEDLNG